MKKLINILAKHFIGSVYEEPTTCSLANAIKDQMGTKDVNVGPFEAFINGKAYKIENNYGPEKYDADKAEAETCLSADDVIRSLYLIPII